MSWQIAAKPHAERIICDFYRIAVRLHLAGSTGVVRAPRTSALLTMTPEQIAQGQKLADYNETRGDIYPHSVGIFVRRFWDVTVVATELLPVRLRPRSSRFVPISLRQLSSPGARGRDVRMFG